jgi:hypothetical protein
MSSYIQSYINEIESLNGTIKNRNEELRKLREQRKQAKRNLLEIMTSYSIEARGKYKRAALDKELNGGGYKRKPAKEKKKDGMQLLRAAGVPDPKTFYNQFLSTQKMPKTS